MTLGYRLIIGLMAVIATIILVRLIESSDVRSAATPEHCFSTEDRERMRTLAIEGVDAGFKEQVAHLITVWMADPSEQPKRATVGMSNALSAYDRARKNALAWNPPRCK